MLDGIYSITYRGTADWGMGVLLLHNGTVTGADVGGVTYDGTFSQSGQQVHFNIVMTVPPGASLVQGTPARSSPYTILVDSSFPAKAMDSGDTVSIDLPGGSVNVIFNRLRTLDN